MATGSHPCQVLRLLHCVVLLRLPHAMLQFNEPVCVCVHVVRLHEMQAGRVTVGVIVCVLIDASIAIDSYIV